MNFVYRPDGHILERISTQLMQFIPDSTRGVPTRQGINVYVPYYLLGGPTERDVCLFTHREEAGHPDAQDKAAAFDRAAERADVCIAMSHKTALDLPEEKTVVVEPAADLCFYRDSISIGVASITQPFNRKGLELHDMIRRIPNVHLNYSGGKIPWENMPLWYHQQDYILVTSNVEGGPMAVKEAIATGRPIIAPDVGWCWDYPCYHYSSAAELEALIYQLAPDPLAFRKFADQFAEAARG